MDPAGDTPGGSRRLDEPEPHSSRLIELIRVAEDRERIAQSALREQAAIDREAAAGSRERAEAEHDPP